MCPPARKIPHESANSLCLSGFQIQSGWQPRWVITQFLLCHLLAIQPRKWPLHWSKWLPENMLTFLSCLIASARSSSALPGSTFYSGLCETYLYRLMYLDTLPLAGSAVWGGLWKDQGGKHCCRNCVGIVSPGAGFGSLEPWPPSHALPAFFLWLMGSLNFGCNHLLPCLPSHHGFPLWNHKSKLTSVSCFWSWRFISGIKSNWQTLK